MPASPASVRILLLADSHLGFDLPTRPRVKRRRRGHDFLANHEKALEPALAGSADLVVHGGDLFHRSRVPPSLVFQAFRGLLEVADAGVPVFVVPGNHERSRIPHEHLAAHPNLHIFRRPETRVIDVRGRRVALTGFPYERRYIRHQFPEILEKSGWHREQADARLLCMHHCVEGATVGPSDFTFRNADDVIRCTDLPSGFAAILSGHIHRHQILRHDLRGRALQTPVLYPGSVERTAFAESEEEKGYVLVDVEPDQEGGRLGSHQFVPLPARPMLLRELCPEAGAEAPWTAMALSAELRATVADVPRDAVLRVKIEGRIPEGVRPALKASRIRAMAPPEMNLEVLIADAGGGRRMARRGPPTGRTRHLPQQLTAFRFQELHGESQEFGRPVAQDRNMLPLRDDPQP
ncbi:MAG: DNA repair exonuclease [Gemmatimonadota bacterium]